MVSKLVLHRRCSVIHRIELTLNPELLADCTATHCLTVAHWLSIAAQHVAHDMNCYKKSGVREPGYEYDANVNRMTGAHQTLAWLIEELHNIADDKSQQDCLPFMDKDGD